MPTHRKEPRDWDSIEQFAKIVSYIFIPVIIALGGWSIQKAIAQQSISKDYMQIAIGILTQPKNNVDPEIRFWAVDLINETSPVKFNDRATAKLKSGEITFPTDPNECLMPAPLNPKTDLVQVEFINNAGSPVMLSVNMYKRNEQNECGAYSYVLQANDTKTATVMEGCYYVYGWIEQGSSGQSVSSSFCLSKSSGLQKVLITSDNISLR